MSQIQTLQKSEVFVRDGFKCQKCGFIDNSGKDLEVRNNITLCSICFKLAPLSDQQFKNYLSKKIDSSLLADFRSSEKSISQKTIRGMSNLVEQGKIVSRPPKGYKLVNSFLVIDEEQAQVIKNIFSEFIYSNVSLTQLAKMNDLTTTGLIKLLKNPVYLGKIRYKNSLYSGNHEPLISQEEFDKAQDKFKKNI